MPPDSRELRADRGAALLVWAAFAYLLAGVNFVNPMLPHLRATLQASAGTIASLYSVYLIALVPLLLLCPRIWPQVSARSRLIAAVALMMLAGCLHAVSDVRALAAGRLTMAASIALGTAAVAQLAVEVAGERGRSATATANTAGALLGTAIGGLALAMLARPLAIVHLVHVGIGSILILALVSRVAAAPAPDGRSARTLRTKGHGGRREGFLLGGFAFATAGAAIVLGPTLFVDAGGDLGARVVYVTIALYACAALSQRLVRASRFGIVMSGVCAVLGLLMMLLSTLTGSFSLLVIGSACTGFGFGAVYKLGLMWTTLGADYAVQGRLAAAYACIAYGYAGVIVIGGGYLADVTGYEVALGSVLALSAATMAIWLAAAFQGPDPIRRRLA